MARSTLFVKATPARVFEVLSDAEGYADWVVGTHAVRAADPDWPKPGARFSYVAGLPPLAAISDETVVRECLPSARLVLEVRARLLPSARVEFRLDPTDGGTQVTLVEDVDQRLLNLLAGPLHLLIGLRNRETLRRLRALAERK